MKSLCVSLETAKALKVAGWTKDTCLAYGKNGEMLEPPFGWSADMDLAFPAPTAEEVLRELPRGFFVTKEINDIWRIFYNEWEDGFGNDVPDPTQTNESLSEAAAQMWLWCVENGYIKTEAKP